MRLSLPFIVLSAAGLLALSIAAHAQAAKPAVPTGWISGIKLLFQAKAGIVGNTSDPDQLRPAKATGWDVGFKIQGLYGSDAWIVHTLGLADQLIHNRNQLDLLEASVTVRAQVFEGGLDVKAGI